MSRHIDIRYNKKHTDLYLCTEVHNHMRRKRHAYYATGDSSHMIDGGTDGRADRRMDTLKVTDGTEHYTSDHLVTMLPLRRLALVRKLAPPSGILFLRLRSDEKQL